MATAWSTLITEYAAVEISDVRLDELLETNPALYFRKMAGYVLNAIPRFNRPPEIRTWLTYTAPIFDDLYYTSDTTQVLPVTVDTGKTDFDLCSVGLIGTDALGNPYYTPVTASYDSDTGEVVIQSDLQAGQEVQFDFYTDGSFTNTLTVDMLRILSLCMQYVWESRFTNDFLIQFPKIKDKSYGVEAEANTSRAGTERLRMLKEQLNAEMLRYEQTLAYIQTMPIGNKLVFPS